MSASATASEARFAQAPPATRVALHDGGADRADVMPRAPRLIAPQRALDRATVRAALAQARATNLAAFRVYQKKGVFPSNTYKPGKLNVWLDEDGNFCAAATIIKMSGKDDLVSQVAEQNNFIRLGDVKQGPLMSWILTSGLTQAEIAAIQEPFVDVSGRRQQPQTPIVVSRDQLEPIMVDAKLRKTEDARLRAKYRSVDKMIAKNTKKSLDLATDQLMKRPALAWQLIDSQSVGFEG